MSTGRTRARIELHDILRAGAQRMDRRLRYDRAKYDGYHEPETPPTLG